MQLYRVSPRVATASTRISLWLQRRREAEKERKLEASVRDMSRFMLRELCSIHRLDTAIQWRASNYVTPYGVAPLDGSLTVTEGSPGEKRGQARFDPSVQEAAAHLRRYPLFEHAKLLNAELKCRRGLVITW